MGRKVNIISNYIELAKVRITVFVALSTTVGYLLGGGTDIKVGLLVTLGVFLFACASGALNHLQEVSYDALMHRTKNRPLPANHLKPWQAIAFISLSLAIGVGLLYLTGNSFLILLSIISLVWYNLIYTPLKRYTSLAVFPGAVMGSIPPAIGWAASGNSLMNPQLWALAVFFFIWQLPHFWFLFLIYDQDYRRGGFPTLSELFSERAIRRISYIWVASLAVSCMLIPFFGVTEHLATNLILLVSGIALVWRTRNLVMQYYSNQTAIYRLAFREINIYVLVVVLVLSIDKIIS